MDEGKCFHFSSEMNTVFDAFGFDLSNASFPYVALTIYGLDFFF